MENIVQIRYACGHRVMAWVDLEEWPVRYADGSGGIIVRDDSVDCEVCVEMGRPTEQQIRHERSTETIEAWLRTRSMPVSGMFPPPAVWTREDCA